MFMIRCVASHKDGRKVTVEGKDPEACDKKALKLLKADAADVKLEMTHRTLEGKRGSKTLETFYTFEEIDEVEKKILAERKKRYLQG